MPSSRVNPISPAAQLDLGFGSSPEQLQKGKAADPGYKEIHEKHNPPEKDVKGKAAENKEFADKRQPQSPLIRQQAINNMKQMLNMAGSVSGGGGAIPKSNRDITKNHKKGGKVSASSRADGCAVRGKTRGRML
jgi:hypothetical protein